MKGYLEPQRCVEPRSTAPSAARYIRSYMILRVLIGVFGFALPILLLLVDEVLTPGDAPVRDSLSAYYYSAARENFVGTLSAIGVFLVTYKIGERSLDNSLSWIAGLAAMAVAFFPTARKGDAPLTPLQEQLGEVMWTSWIHYGAAAVFIVSLGFVCWQFGRREGEETEQRGKRSPEFWRRYHRACAIVIWLAVLWCLLSEVALDGPRRAILYGEWVAAWAFSASWFMKGFEIDYLRRTSGLRPEGAERPGTTGAAG